MPCCWGAVLQGAEDGGKGRDGPKLGHVALAGTKIKVETPYKTQWRLSTSDRL